MKSLKYEGMVKLKIFWRIRRLETGLSGFKLKRVHYGKLGLQIIKNHLISPQPNTPSLLSLSSKPTPLTSLLQFRVGPSPPSPFSSSHLTTLALSLSLFPRSLTIFMFFIFSPSRFRWRRAWTVTGHGFRRRFWCSGDVKGGWKGKVWFFLWFSCCSSFFNFTTQFS